MAMIFLNTRQKQWSKILIKSKIESASNVGNDDTNSIIDKKHNTRETVLDSVDHANDVVQK